MSRRPAASSFVQARIRAKARAMRDAETQHYDAGFVTAPDRTEFLGWLASIHPLWEERFSAHHPPPPGKTQRPLLRPVYWLGSWQFACLGYYQFPKYVKNRCVTAEPFPPVMRRWIAEVERRARKAFSPHDVPKGWHLNTCLVNLYGRRRDGEKWVDTARVGEHKDSEPGPVASISLGERALFQFVSSSGQDQRDSVESQQWLDDGSLQLFAGDRLKKHLFHRVQRVDHKTRTTFDVNVANFETRRVNLTFRYVPPKDVLRYRELPPEDREDVQGYMETLARGSDFFRRELA